MHHYKYLNDYYSFEHHQLYCTLDTTAAANFYVRSTEDTQLREYEHISETFPQQLPTIQTNPYSSLTFSQFQFLVDQPYIMDVPNTVIGSNSRSAGQDRNFEQKSLRKPSELVDIYAKGRYIATCHLRLLVRFSSTAAEAFPKPKDPNHASKDCETNRKEHLAVEDDAKVNVRKMMEEFDNLQIVKGGECEQKDPSSATVQERVRKNVIGDLKNITECQVEASAPLVKLLNLDREDVWEPPRPEAVKAFLGWMRANRTVRGYEKLTEFHIPQQSALCSLIDMYAAAVALKIRPFPHHLYATLLCELSDRPPKVADIQYLALRVPIDDHAVTRSITTAVKFHEHRAYTREEWTDILAMRGSEDWRYLYHRLKRIQRKGRSREHDKQTKADTEANWNEMDKQAFSSAGGEKRALGLRQVGGDWIDHRRRSHRQTQTQAANIGSDVLSISKHKSVRAAQVGVEPAKGPNGSALNSSHVPEAHD